MQTQQSDLRMYGHNHYEKLPLWGERGDDANKNVESAKNAKHVEIKTHLFF